MPVQKSNSENSACPDLAIYIFQILLTTFNNFICVEKCNLHFNYVLEDGFRKVFGITLKRSKLKILY